MSRIGKRPVELPKGVTVTVQGSKIEVKGPKGTLTRQLHKDVDVKVEGTVANIKLKREDPLLGRFHGLTRTLVSNMVLGVTTGFSKRLKLVGVGYRAAAAGKKVTLSLGYSHPIDYEPPAGI